jgi:sulfotransferase family protein
MFELFVTLESRLDAVLPRPRLRGQTPAELIARAREWSEAAWNEAESVGPFPIGSPEIARGMEVARRPVFVCGVHRSGTTLVHDLLDGHPALTVLPSEGSFYTSHRRHLSHLEKSEWRDFMACEWCRRLANPVNQPPYWSIGRSTPDHSPAVAFMRAVAAWWTPVEEQLGERVAAWPLVAIALAYASHPRAGALDAGVERWVEKTPTNERYLEEIWREFPEARVVHVVRDPVAVIASRKRREERATGGFRNMTAALADLAESYRIAEAARTGLDDHRYLLIHFEQLVQDPDLTIAQLAAFLDVPDMAILHEPTSGGLPATINSSYDVTETRAIDPARVRAEPGALSPDERLRVAVAVGDAAATLGYSVPA